MVCSRQKIQVMNLYKTLTELSSCSLQETLQETLRLIRGRGCEELERWLKLELNGYWTSNPAMTDDTLVPDYRQIVGEHMDDYGGRLVIPLQDLAFVNTSYARWGVIDLEQMYLKGGTYSIQQPDVISMISEHLGVEVTKFQFDARQLRSTLSTIRTELEDRVASLPRKVGGVEVDASSSDPILELKPNFYGIGIDLRSLAMKWKDVISRRKK